MGRPSETEYIQASHDDNTKIPAVAVVLLS